MRLVASVGAPAVRLVVRFVPTTSLLIVLAEVALSVVFVPAVVVWVVEDKGPSVVGTGFACSEK